MKTIKDFTEFMEGFLDERHQTQAYKAATTNTSSAYTKKAIHKGLLSTPVDLTLKGKIKDLAGSIRNRRNIQPANESFKSVQNKIAKKGHLSKESAGAILANSSRHASAKAKRKNPKLKKVKG